MQIDTAKITGSIGNATGGFFSMLLGQSSEGKSQKWLALVVFSIIAVLCVWKLKALDINVVFMGLLHLTMFWMACHAFESAAKAIADALASKKV